MVLKSILGVSALILSIVNGIMLLRSYLRDKPRLTVKPVHPDTYQWFFTLPGSEHQDQTTRKYGFLCYVSITNRGLRDVCLDYWHLRVKTVGEKWVELKPVNIPEPQSELGKSGNLKIWPVLGQKGLYHEGDTMIRSGGSASGFAYYIAEFSQGGAWDSLVKDERAFGKIVVQSVFGNRANAKIIFKKISLEKAKRMVEGIDQVDFCEAEPDDSR